MLSILIPTYNYNTFLLVKTLQEQAQREQLIFEIIVSDDASTDAQTIRQNEAVRGLEHCQYHYNTENLGRGENRNALCLKAQYPWVLLLDCDTMPVASTFVKKYADYTRNPTQEVFFGGIAYEETPPKKDELLRWVYGMKREAIPLRKRLRKPYESALVSNILVKKDILLQHPFHAEIYNYGFEDFVFIAELKKNNIPVAQIENPVYHLNLEKSVVFLEKHLAALHNLHLLIEQKIIAPKETKIGRLRHSFQNFGFDGLIATLFRQFEPTLRDKIISDKPSLWLFDFYKLGYFCSLKKS
ncbi:glycosyltransferase [Flavobacterium sp.]|uniref:glycosyltransferase family 2 protein n=1 Tax=Flavobacterium sp. TaxID=239 RepID=UPI002637D93B|nr:glycosyltransferase [Flavobacterium sp.]